MTAYLISDITVRDRAAFEVYRTRAADAIGTYGGRYLARLGEVQVLEGSWNPNMIGGRRVSKLGTGSCVVSLNRVRIRP
jgi:uncharacterized protein (DUF1330 family)